MINLFYLFGRQIFDWNHNHFATDGATIIIKAEICNYLVLIDECYVLLLLRTD